MEKETFWKGVSAGFLAGMAVAAALRYSPFEKFITGLSTLDGKIDRNLEKLEEKLEPVVIRRPVVGNIVSNQASRSTLRREQTEDTFSHAAERAGRDTLEVQENASERADHIDLSQPLRRYPQSLDLGSAG